MGGYRASTKPNQNTARFVAALVLLGYLCGCSPKPLASPIKRDETVVFFDTSAWLEPSGTRWIVPIHGWIYEPANSTFRKGLLATALRKKYALEATESTQRNFDRRAHLFLVDNERGKRLTIRLGHQEYRLPSSRANGHVHTQLRVPASQVEQFARHERLSFSVVPSTRDGRTFTGRVYLIKPTGVSVISDIDDTIKVSHVTDRAKLFDQTFFQDFTAVPGMATLYNAWAKQGVAFHFVSASPWQLYESLRAFTRQAGFPAASFHLKYVRIHPADKTFWHLFKPSTAIKPGQIEPILQAYPEHRFLLIGDSGEHDPEIYAALLRKYPTQVERIYIRNVTGAAPTDARFQQTFAGIAPAKWRLFTNPATLELP